MKLLIKISEVWQLFGPYKKSAVYLFIMLFIASFLEAISIGMLLPILNLIINNESNSILGDLILSPFGEQSKKQSLIIVLILFFIFIVFKNIFILVKTRVHGNFSFGIRGLWMKELMAKYISSDYNYILDSQQGSLINNIIVESEKAQFCLKYIIQFTSSLLLTIFMLSVMFITSWKISLVLIVVTVFVALLTNKTINTYSRSVGSKKLKYARAISNEVTESISLIKQIKTLGLEDRTLEKFKSTADLYIKILTKFFVLSRVPSNVTEIINVGVIVGAVIYILLFTNLNISELAPIVAVFVIIGNKITVQAGQLINSKMEILSNLESLRKLDSLISDIITTEKLDEGIVCQNINGDIVFNAVTFSYQNRKKILDELNMVIPQGSFVFLIGESGSGKSCIVDILLRLQNPTNGVISIDNKSNIVSYSISSWRKRIAYVSQDIMLFNKTIRENLLDGNPLASDDDILSILKQVNAFEFVSMLPEGLNTIVGDRGVKLSGGQRQRLALARVLIRDVDFLILDEATSALDQSLEEEIIKELKVIAKGKTVLFITHRLSTAVHADVIYTLDQGRANLLSKDDLNAIISSY